MAWDWETVDVMDPIDIAELLDKKDDTIAALKREILTASVTVQAGGKEWATVPAIKDEIHNLRSALEKIERHGCENYTTGIGTCYHAARFEDAEFGADRCCHPCIAHRALLGFT